MRCVLHDIELYSIACCRLSVYLYRQLIISLTSGGYTDRQSLAEMVPWLIVVGRVDVPTSCVLAVHSNEISLPNVICKVVLRHITAVRELEGLVLNLGSVGVKGEIRQLLVLISVVAVSETTWVEAPQCPEN